MKPPTPPRRVLNMQRRRARILKSARDMLTGGGFEALNLRELARQADVTVPTIYNLVGNKEELLVELFAEALTEIEARMDASRAADPLQMAEAVVIESTAVFARDEDYYRAAFAAVEYLDHSAPHHDTVARLYRWGERLVTAGFLACAEARLLRGRIPPIAMGEMLLRSYRTSCRAWAFRQLALADFRRVALTDVYLTLAADAVDTFHATLSKKIQAVGAPARAPTVPTRRVRRTGE